MDEAPATRNRRWSFFGTKKNKQTKEKRRRTVGGAAPAAEFQFGVGGRVDEVERRQADGVDDVGVGDGRRHFDDGDVVAQRVRVPAGVDVVVGGRHLDALRLLRGVQTHVVGAQHQLEEAGTTSSTTTIKPSKTNPNLHDSPS